MGKEEICNFHPLKDRNRQLFPQERWKYATLPMERQLSKFPYGKGRYRQV